MGLIEDAYLRHCLKHTVSCDLPGRLPRQRAPGAFRPRLDFLCTISCAACQRFGS